MLFLVQFLFMLIMFHVIQYSNYDNVLSNYVYFKYVQIISDGFYIYIWHLSHAFMKVVYTLI